MLIAQISDLHVMRAGKLAHGDFDTYATLERCLRQLSKMRPEPDVLFATGDLADSGAMEEYGRIRDLFARLAMPVYLIPGNHDRRDTLRSVFGSCAWLPPGNGALHYAIDGYPVQLLALDTLVDGEEGGALDLAQVAWLDRTLAADHRPAVVFMHHPPVPTGIRRMDAISLEPASAARLAQVIERHPHVHRIVCGHVHRSVQSAWHGTLVSVCPSTAYQCVLDLAQGEFRPSRLEPPAYQLHYWNAGSLSTHTIMLHE